MSKKKRDTLSPPADATSRDARGSVRPLVPALLLGISAVASMLALYQWMELLIVRAGGTAACNLNDVLDCAKVWDSPFASGIHSTFGIPVAGMGLVWGLAAFAVSLVWTYRLLAGGQSAGPAAALKLVAWIGAASIPVLGGVAFASGAVCLLCLATYVVVGAFALVAVKMVPGGAFPKGEGFKTGAMWTAGLMVAAYLVALGPGIATPKSGGGSASGSALAKLPASTPAQPSAGTQAQSNPHAALSAEDQAIAQFLQSLSPQERQMVSNGIAMYAGASTPSQPPPAARRIYGSANAPVKVVEWVDFRCGACRYLNDTMRELKRVAPEGALSIEARNFPLDSECNPYVQMSDGLGARCAAAKATICLESQKDFWTLRDQIFATQQGMTKERVLQAASSGSMGRKDLEACIASPETTKKLQEDIEYAMRFNPQGTPLLVVNGRETMAGAAGPLLYALSLTGGNANSPAFRTLPQPRALDPHAGHNHGPGEHHGHNH